MLGFKRNIFGFEGNLKVHEIAERCATATMGQLSTAAETMSAAQFRGYVRAHAWPQVCAETLGAEAHDRMTNAQANDLAAKALEQTVHLVTRVYLSAPIVAMPAPHIGRRAAA